MARARSPPRFFCFICVLLGLSVWCVLALVVLDRKSRATGLVVGRSKSAQVRATLARANARYIHTVRDALDAALDLFDDDAHDDAAPGADADAAREIRDWVEDREAAVVHGVRLCGNQIFNPTSM